MSRFARLVMAAAFLTLGGAEALSGQGVRTLDVDYVGDAEYADDKDLLDIYMPEGARDVPIVVFFHGGALRAGDKSAGQNLAERLVPQGIGVVSANYRLTPSVMHPAHVQDAASATAWVIDNIARFGGDPRNVYVAGHSAGAYLAALLVLDPTHLRAHRLSPAALGGAIPISAFLYVEETAADRPKDVWGTDPDDWLAASVTPHVREGAGRMLLIYADGDADWRRAQNDRFGEAMRAAGNRWVHVVEVPNRDHSGLMTELDEPDDQIGDLIPSFVRRHE